MKKSNSKTVNTIMVVISLIIGVLTAFFIWGENFISFNSLYTQENDNAGQFVLLQNDVRKKSEENFVWLKANNNEKVFLGDSIFTGQESQARIMLKDGSFINLSQNSLIVLKFNDQHPDLELQLGQFVGEIAHNKKLSILHNKKRTYLSGKKAKIKIRKNNDGKINVMLLKGKLNIENGNEIKKIDKTNDGINISAKGEIITENLNLIYPQDNQTIWFTKNIAQDFKWEILKGIKNYLFEVYQDENLTKLIYKKLIKQDNILSLKLKNERNFYWRVSAIKNKKNWISSMPFKLNLKKLSAPNLTLPNNNWINEVEINNKNNKPQKVNFKWDDSLQSQKYEMQISMQKDFSSIIYKNIIRKKEHLVNDLKWGSYYWKIRSISDNRPSSPWSIVFNFTLKAKIKISAPILKNKEYFKFISSYKLLEKPKKEQSPLLIWNEDKNISNYEIIIAKDDLFDQIISRNKIRTNQFNWQDYKIGKYFWKVFAINNEGINGPDSNIGKFEVISSPPTLENILDEIKEKKPLETDPIYIANLKWKKNPIAKKYEILIADNKEFTKANQIFSYNNFKNFKIDKSGDYFWKVRGLDVNNKKISDFSSVDSFSYKINLAKTKIELEKPVKNITIFFQENAKPYIWLKWSLTKENRSITNDQNFMYYIRLSKDPQFKDIFFTTTTKDNKYLLNKTLPLGKIYWQIGYLDEKQKKEWSHPYNFYITYNNKNNNNKNNNNNNESNDQNNELIINKDNK